MRTIEVKASTHVDISARLRQLAHYGFLAIGLLLLVLLGSQAAGHITDQAYVEGKPSLRQNQAALAMGSPESNLNVASLATASSITAPDAIKDDTKALVANQKIKAEETPSKKTEDNVASHKRAEVRSDKQSARR